MVNKLTVFLRINWSWDEFNINFEALSWSRRQGFHFFFNQGKNTIGLKISYEKTKVMAIDPSVITNVMINGNKVQILERSKYLREIITYTVNKKAV